MDISFTFVGARFVPQGSRSVDVDVAGYALTGSVDLRAGAQLSAGVTFCLGFRVGTQATLRADRSPSLSQT